MTKTITPAVTSNNSAASPSILPKTVTGEAGLGRPSVLAGVGPKKIQKAFPTGQ